MKPSTFLIAGTIKIKVQPGMITMDTSCDFPPAYSPELQAALKKIKAMTNKSGNYWLDKK